MIEAKGESVRVAIICPSLGKSCGIARYSHYVAQSVKRLGIQPVLMRSSNSLFEEGAAPYDFILVQHEYGLFDNLSPLGTGETTSTLIVNLERYLAAHPASRAAVIMHTIVLTDHVLNIANQCLFNSSIPVVNLNSRGSYELAIPHLEHGVFIYQDENGQPVLRPKKSTAGLERPTLGSFGLLSPNKKPTLIIDICDRAQANFVGNFATTSRTAARELSEYAERLKVPATIYTDFCEEQDLLDRLAPMDFGVVTQEPISHWATSGSIRFLFNFGVPILVPYGPQFEDCGEGVIFTHQDEMHFSIESLYASSDTYQQACERTKDFARENEMSLVYEKFLAMLAATPPSHLTDYRPRNFREQRRSVTMVDMMLLGGIHRGQSAADAEQAVITACAQGTEAATELYEIVDEQLSGSPLKFSIGCEGLISCYLTEADRLNLLSSCSTLQSNIRQVERFLSHDDSLPAARRREISRDLANIQRDYGDVLSNKMFSASVTGKLLRQLFPETYAAAGREAVTALRRIMQDYIDRIGFRGTNSRSPVRVPVLLVMPAAKILSYLFRVGGLSSDEILALVAEAGLPDDIFDNRLEWVESAAAYIRQHTATPVSAAIGTPQEFQTRYRAYLSEFALMTTEQFIYSAIALFFKSQPSRQRLQDVCMAIDGRPRSVALNYISQQPEAMLFQSMVVDMDGDACHDDLSKPILIKKIIDEFFLNEKEAFNNTVAEQNFFQISRFWLFHSLSKSLENDLFREKKVVGMDDRLPPKARPASPAFWLPDSLLQDFVAAMSGERAPSVNAILFEDGAGPSDPSTFAEAAPVIGNLADLDKFIGTLSSPSLHLKAVPEPWTKTAAEMPTRSRTGTLAAFQERMVGSKMSPAFESGWTGDSGVVGLPDHVWSNAWNSIAVFNGARIVAPQEFSQISPWVLTFDRVTPEEKFDFVIVHKGQKETIPDWLKTELLREWHPYYANEVFVVFCKRFIQSLAFQEIHLAGASDLVASGKPSRTPPRDRGDDRPTGGKTPSGRKGFGKLLTR